MRKWRVGSESTVDADDRGGEFDYEHEKRDMRRTTVREGTEPHQLESGDDPYSELFASTPKVVDIQGARAEGR